MPSTVDISGETFNVYLDDEQADIYMIGAYHNANWTAATAENKRIALVTATRILDRQKWLGSKTSDAQALEWPRTGTGVDGVADDTVPSKIEDASAELALSLLDGSDVQTSQNVAQKIQMLKAGSVQLQYFRGAEGAALRFPLIVDELVRDYLEGASALDITGLASGTGGTSVTSLGFGLNRSL